MLTPSLRQMSYSNFMHTLFFSVCTICGHLTNCKIHFSQHLYFISYKWADAHCWFRPRYLFLLVPIWVEVHRFILECNKISIFVFRTYFWTKKIIYDWWIDDSKLGLWYWGRHLAHVMFPFRDTHVVLQEQFNVLVLITEQNV